MVRSERQWQVPLCVSLPIELLEAEEPFPFLDTTLTDLGITPASVQERVVWMDSRRTRVRGRGGKLREREVLLLEVRVRAQRPGDPRSQEVLYSTETHTDRQYCRSTVSILPWRHSHSEGVPVISDKEPLEMVAAVDTESHPKWQKIEERREMNRPTDTPSDTDMPALQLFNCTSSVTGSH
ncbi:uncharacterized protein LOC136768588 [Amia ocellicauda]|uniref:uncharacterized protein LOC136768588 n=1 Tax=Amia ocellicauda TaxID=2972642 RepID=UPI0034640A86